MIKIYVREFVSWCRRALPWLLIVAGTVAGYWLGRWVEQHRFKQNHFETLLKAFHEYESTTGNPIVTQQRNVASGSN